MLKSVREFNSININDKKRERRGVKKWKESRIMQISLRAVCAQKSLLLQWMKNEPESVAGKETSQLLC